MIKNKPWEVFITILVHLTFEIHVQWLVRQRNFFQKQVYAAAFQCEFLMHERESMTKNHEVKSFYQSSPVLGPPESFLRLTT